MRAHAQIFNYLDRLFHVVKPQRVCYMAIDGPCHRRQIAAAPQPHTPPKATLLPPCQVGLYLLPLYR